MAQSIHDKQEHLKVVVGEVTAKPESELTKEDASELMSAEVCRFRRTPHERDERQKQLTLGFFPRVLSRAMDGIRPPKGSTSAHFQSVADRNARNQEQTKQE